MRASYLLVSLVVGEEDASLLQTASVRHNILTLINGLQRNPSIEIKKYVSDAPAAEALIQRAAERSTSQTVAANFMALPQEDQEQLIEFGRTSPEAHEVFAKLSPEARQAALLAVERHLDSAMLEKGAAGKAAQGKGKKVDRTVNNKNKKVFPFTELGPFELVEIHSDLSTSLTINETAGTWTANGKTGTLRGGPEKLGAEGKRYWSVLEGADEVDWAYQPKNYSNSTSFEQYGGFIVRNTDAGTDKYLEIRDPPPSDGEYTDPLMTMTFGKPFWFGSITWKKCKNPAPITIKSLSDDGAKEYCWETDHKSCPMGCFFYNTKKGYMGFAVKDFALKTLGPFPLVMRDDLVTALPGVMEQYQHNGTNMALGALDYFGRDYWLGAAEVDWVYHTNEASAKLFEKYGGFLLRNGLEKDGGTVTHALEINNTGEPELTLHFGEPFHVSQNKWSKCQNPHKITITALSDDGAKEYCWETDETKCKRGCFLYHTKNGYQGFPVKMMAMQSLGPFYLTARDDINLTKSNDNISWSAGNGSWSLTGKISETLLGVADGVHMDLGPWGSLGEKGMVITHVDWAYPGEGGNGQPTVFEATGGFVLKDAAWEALQVLEIDKDAEEAKVKKTVCFGTPFYLTKENWEKCQHPSDITIDALDAAGASQYCWETDAGHQGIPRCGARGCFIYDTAVGYQGFQVTQIFDGRADCL